MKGYDNYKDSGVEWIGEIPENWENVRLKLISSITKGRKPNKDYEDYFDGLVPYLSMEYLRDKTDEPIYAEANEKNIVIVDEGDILILWDGSKAGEIVRAKKGVLSSTMAKIAINDSRFESIFLNYLLQLGEKHIQANTIGMGIPHVNGNILKDLMMLLPTSEEQTKIASFLDYKNNLIDATIEKKKRLIELLKEKRQAVINEAVTKGLNPNAPIKDSGVEWLGEIPEHWKVKSLKHVVSCNDDTLNDKTDKDLEINYIEIGDVSLEKGIENYTKMKFSEAPSRARRIVKENDIILSTVRTYLKAITKVNSNYDNFIASTGFAVLRSKSINPDFLGAIVKTENFIDEVISLSVGVSYPAINSSILLDISIPLPPEDEQLMISDKIDKEFISFQNLILKIEVAIEKLQAYRQSLISEAVTGKIDVRDWPA